MRRPAPSYRLAVARRLALALAISVPAACSGGGGGGPASQVPVAPTSRPTAVPSAAPSVPTPVPTSLAPASGKRALQGLVTMGAVPSSGATPSNAFEELYAHPGVYVAAVVNLYWSQLEPAQGVFDDSALNAALAGIASYDVAYPATPVVAKLRIRMGAGTPAWVIAATGAVAVTDASGDPFTIGEFWTPAYRGYWQALQAHLAAEFDGSPAVGEVAITSCSTLTGEPFVLAHSPTSVAALHAAGYDDALGMACLNGAPADYAAWKTTPLDYTFNPFFATDTGAAGVDTAFPVQVMAAFRAALGTRGVVANHGLQAPLATGAQPIYTEFQSLTASAAAQSPPSIAPLEFQTVSPTVDWPSTIALGLTYHPTEIEIWDTVAAGGAAPLSQSQLQGWASTL